MPDDMTESELSQPSASDRRGGRWARRARITWAVASVLVTESVILGLAVLPSVSFWRWLAGWSAIPPWAQVLAMAMGFVPAYLLFASGLLLYSAVVTRLFGWRTRPGLELRLSDMTWPVLDWGRYLVTIHVARLFAGAVFRSTPVWTMYLRLNGARIGRGGWINSLKLMDHNLLTVGPRVIIGSDASVSGHVIERGVLRTAPVVLGEGVTIGINSVVGIGTTIGAHTQVGALSLVPKFATLEAGAVYAGTPVRLLRRTGDSRDSDSRTGDEPTGDEPTGDEPTGVASAISDAAS